MLLRKQLAGLAAWVVLTAVAAIIGGVASIDAPVFYQQLTLPDWAPPAGVFGPVWTVLYLLMAVAAWLVWSRHGMGAARTALTVFIAQLIANSLWSWLFFGWHLGAAAFVEILVLWVLIVITLAQFWRLHRLAGLLLMPYLLWVTFAAALTFATWQLNPQLL